MSLLRLEVLILAALVIRWVCPRKWLSAMIMVVSVLGIFWLQPLSPIRHLDFWFPFFSIILTVLVWALTNQHNKADLRSSLGGGIFLVLLVLGITILRYFQPLCCLTPSTPPPVLYVTGMVILCSLIILLAKWLGARYKSLLVGMIVMIIVIFVVLKSQALSIVASSWIRGLSRQPQDLASAGDLPWLGFSFIAFRLLHVIRDRQAGRLMPSSIKDFTAYTFFFPAVIAGPIDRNQHFLAELQRAQSHQQEAHWHKLATDDLAAGLLRVLVGGVKKFALADNLALIALNPQNALQIQTSLMIWIALLAYSWRIYFDFSGYTDIALGLARILGIQLPENFDRPYTRLNLTAFWNSWHITLAQWFRSYVFNPLTRYLRTRSRPVPIFGVILIGQLVTMTLIGIWHGISWNFLIWGIWHGVGLFIQNRWSDWLRGKLDFEGLNPSVQFLIKASSWLSTFIYVSLGWVFFALPSTELSWSVLLRLFGAGK